MDKNLNEINGYDFLKSFKMKEEILKQGYCVSQIPISNCEEQKRFILNFLENMIDRDNHLSLYINDIVKRKMLNEYIRNTNKQVFDTLFQNFKIATSSTVVKKSNGLNFKSHQDPTMVVSHKVCKHS